ncbi:MAG: hypothetical protein KY450_05740, partial [Actinobacteria bacterium]|nr:hypothetical protein [Actinomycetota bacterium]
PEYGDYARRAAEAIDSTAQKLRSKNPDELIDDTRNFVRKSPGVALAGAAIVGFALARLVKSGLDAAGIQIPFPQRTLGFLPGARVRIGGRTDGDDDSGRS